MEKSKNIIITILIILIIGFAGMMCYHVFVVEDKEEVKESDNAKDIETITTKKIDFKDGKATVTIDGKDVVISFEDKGSSQAQSYLLLNDKKVFINKNLNAELSDLYIMDDIFLIPTYSSDIRGTRLYIIDKDGNILKEISDNLDSTINGMSIESSDKSLTFKNNRIIIKGTRLGHYSQISYNNIENAFVCGNPDESSKVNNIDKIPENAIVEATYEIEYLGDNKLSDIKMVEGTEKTLKQAKIEYCK